jgi:predicted restriction endonuclease
MSRSNLNRKPDERRNALLSLIYLCGSDKYFLTPSQTYEPLAKYFNLTVAERDENQNDKIGDSRNHWEILLQNSRQQLVSRGFIDKSKREVWKLTEKGIKKAQQISNDFKILVNIYEQNNSSKNESINHLTTLNINYQNDSLNPMVFLDNISEADIHLLNVDTVYSEDINEPSERVMSVNYRIVRDTIITQKIKKLYNYKCQLCKKVLILKNNTLYNEAHHIKPLGSPHNGPDTSDNIVCVCPEHHVLLDYGAIKLDKEQMTIHPLHKIRDEFISYHNKNIFDKL